MRGAVLGYRRSSVLRHLVMLWLLRLVIVVLLPLLLRGGVANVFVLRVLLLLLLLGMLHVLCLVPTRLLLLLGVRQVLARMVLRRLPRRRRTLPTA